MTEPQIPNLKIRRNFWIQVKVGDARECWPFRGEVMPSGYGRYVRPYSKEREKAHRVALEDFHGPLGDLHALHHCDNKLCCNPGHLYAGTHAQNMHDAKVRGRMPDQKGSRNPGSRLTETDIPRIRQMISAGMTNIDIGEEFGVHHATISLIRRGKTWAHTKNDSASCVSTSSQPAHTQQAGQAVSD